ncbi:nucleotidyltransferase [Tissierellaceae bacterium HCP3S3_D8]
MKVISFIVEYNPFHNGHRYHLEQSIASTNATHTIAIMSGSFVQRGEPSLVDKWTKAKMAIDNGMDLVIELPFIYSCQSAELFAHGAIHIMDSLNIVDNICFGTELDDLHSLDRIAKVLLEEPTEFKEGLRKYLSQGFSFPKARSSALIDYFEYNSLDQVQDCKVILKQSNNILAIEYLKALHRLRSKIKPVSVKRSGSDYNDISLGIEFASATGIRKSILENGLDSIRNYVPYASFQVLSDFDHMYGGFNSIENYYSIFRYLIATCNTNEIEHLFDVDHGLVNRIMQQIERSQDMYSLIDNISTKRYPKTRIQRILIHLLNRLNKDEIIKLYKANPPYIRILGSNDRGFSLIREIEKNSTIPIINKFSDHRKYTDSIMKEFIHYEEKATDIYFLGLNRTMLKMDYRTSPYIKRR